ncbi:MAG: hypothetical protein IT243_00325 [Bacteroidia bacterium]|nr:hypothetical protein [Bacteroidia bacterium]
MVSIINDYIENSDSLGRKEAENLEDLRAKFPYFQVLHILIAKSHKNQNTFGFNKNLRLASLYSGNRKILYNFINNETEVKQKSEAIDEIITVPQPEPEPQPEPITELPEDIETKIEERITETEKVPEINEIAEETTDKIITDPQPQPQPEPITELPEDIETKIEERITETEKVPEINEIAEETTDKKITDPQPQPEPEQNNTQDQNSETSENLVSELPIEMSFFDWLDNIESPIEEEIKEKNAEEISKTDTIIILPNTNIEEENENDGNYDPAGWADLAYDIQAYVKQADEKSNHKNIQLSKDEVDSILDNFLSKNPSISKPKAEFYKPENMAKKSEEFHTDIASETLANLFYKQGLLHKSLELYEKLLLQSPNKKDIFAEKIKIIKEELINKL